MDKWALTVPSLCSGMLEKFHNARFGVLIFLFCFGFGFTRTGKSKRQGDDESDPALFLLEIPPTETQSSPWHLKHDSECITCWEWV